MTQKIGIFINDYTILGGTEKVSSNLSKLFIENGIANVTILSLNKKYSEPYIEFPSKVKIAVLNESNKKIRNKEIAALVSEYVKKERITTLIIQVVSNLRLTSLIVNSCQDTNCIPVIHGSPLFYNNYYADKFESIRSFKNFVKRTIYSKYKNRNLFRKITLNSSNLICLSPKCKAELTSKMKVKNDNIIVIPNPLSFNLSNQEYTKENRIIYVGRIENDKNILTLITLWEELSKSHTNWMFDLLGDGNQFELAKRLIKEKGLERITLYGSVKNVDFYFKRSKICILLSPFEGLPTSLLEASLFKNALIAYDGDGGTADIVQNNLNGFLSAYGDKNDLIKNLKLLMDSPQLVSKFGENSFKKLDKYSDDLIFSEWKKILV